MAYNLLIRIPNGLQPILTIYENYVADQGKAILDKLGGSVAKVS
jgi:hypothetical protein